jgi:NADP-dependent 3-hydroxy acid dehydrogenase YdfG
MLRLSSRVIAITGASAGIGRAIAESCAREGAAVVVFARRSDRLDDLVGSIVQAGGRALAVVGDVSDPAQVDRLVAETLAMFGRLDVMVCNAGIGFHGAVDETPVDAMRRLVDVNVLGTLYAARSAVRVFRRQGAGHVIAVSSISGRRGVGGSSVYSATKAAQIAFIEGLRAEFTGTALRASVVLPVRTETEFREAILRNFGHAVSGRGPAQTADHVARRVVECIISPTAEVYPYPRARVLSILNVVAPAMTDRIVRRFNRKQIPASTDGRSHP